MKRHSILIAVIALISTFVGCGGSNSSTTPPPTTPVSISLSPATATVNAGLTVQLNATVQNTTNTAVNWQANGVSGGNVTVGTIGSDGVYHAPAAVPNPATVTITAVSAADPTKSASANISITAPVAVTLSPAPVMIGAGQTYTFGATVLNHSNQSVTWSVSGSPATGTITAEGLYTAPKSVPAGQTVTVKATSQVDPTKSASASVDIVYSNTTFSGSHVLSMFGSDMTGSFWLYGQFTADESGHIVSGKATFRKATGSTSTVNDNIALEGTYTLGANGRGAIALTTTPPTINNVAGPVTFGLVVASDKAARLTTRDQYFNAQGDLFLQDTTALSTSALTGTWVLRWGPAAGRMTLDGAGHVTAVLEDTYTAASTGTTYTGTYGVDADGRATLNITGDPANAGPMRVYIVDSTQIYLLATDVTRNGAGFATKQQDAPFSKASLKGTFAFSMNGRLLATPSRQQASVGLITLDGAGGFTGQMDNSYDMPSSVDPVQTFSGTYDVDSAGRAVLTPVEGPTIYAHVFSKQHVVLLATSADFNGSGQAWLQQGAPFSAASLKGNYSWTFTSSSNSLLGTLTSDGLGTMTGMADVLFSGGMITDLAGSATYTVEPSGRGTVTMTMGPSYNVCVFYMISPGSIRMEGPTEQAPVSGFATQRF